MNRRSFIKSALAATALTFGGLRLAEASIAVIKPVREPWTEYIDGDCWLDTTSNTLRVRKDGEWSQIHDSVLTNNRPADNATKKHAVYIEGHLKITGAWPGELGTAPSIGE